MPQPPTLDSLIRDGSIITTWCEACQTIGERFEPADLAARFGADRAVKSLDRLFRCKRCGVRGKVTTQVAPGSKEYRG